MSAPTRSLDHFARLLRLLLRTDVALVSVLVGEEQLMPGAAGLEGQVDADRRVPLTHSLCRHVVSGRAPVVVADARADPRYAEEPAVQEYGVVSYAGYPLEATDGRVLGSLCAVGGEPRHWEPDDLAVLQELAGACAAELEERQLQQASSEALVRTLLDNLDVAVVLYDEHGRLVLANQLARRAVETAGMSLEHPPYAGPRVRRADNRTPVPFEEQLLPRALRGEELDEEMTWFGPFGQERAVAARSRLLRRDDGRPWATLVSAHDVTELARALQVKESFVSTVSHELRTPLTAVLGYAELLADELADLPGDTTSAQHAVEVVRRRATDLQVRIADLLDVADLRRRLAMRSVDVGELARDVVSRFADPAFEAGRHLDLQVRGPQLAQVDPARMTQVLDHLLTNAVRHASGAREVTVLVGGDEEWLTLVVCDDGGGMTTDEQAQAFDRFWRAEHAHVEAVPGIGLGLSLVRDVVLAHHGEVHLDSGPGEGTTVRVRLPRSPVAVS